MTVFAQLAIAFSVSLPPAPPGVGDYAQRLTPLAATVRTDAKRRGGERDAWLGDDKFRHFFMSFAAASFTFAGMRLLGTRNALALPVAVGASTAAGIGKEIHDRALGRPFSVRDLVWDAAGTGAGVLLLREVR